MKIIVKDTHTLCPIGGLPTEIQVGTQVELTQDGRKQTFLVTGRTQYMAFFKGQKFEIVGASRATPKEIEITLLAA